jgi:hypothetical protein
MPKSHEDLNNFIFLFLHFPAKDCPGSQYDRTELPVEGIQQEDRNRNNEKGNFVMFFGIQKGLVIFILFCFAFKERYLKCHGWKL